ncbi:MAG: TadE/TadG family type IV pilus assembly protein [Anaerolineae bacterium]
MRRRCEGQDLIEFALVTPLLLVIVLVFVEFAVVVFQYNAVASAARQGARHGIVARGSNAQVQAIAEAAAEEMATAASLNPARLDVDVQVDATRVEVQVAYETRLITAPVIQAIGGGSSGPFTLRATSSMIRE